MDSKITVHIHSTITPLTTPTNWVLRKKVLDYQKKYDKYIHQSWNIIANPPFLDPTKYGHFVLEDLQKLIDLVEKGTDEYNLLKGYEKAIKDDPQPDEEMLKEFVRFSDVMDGRRNLNWRKTYPKLNEFIGKSLRLNYIGQDNE